MAPGDRRGHAAARRLAAPPPTRVTKRNPPPAGFSSHVLPHRHIGAAPKWLQFKTNASILRMVSI
ncbi:hypothetical protein EGY16_10850 [Burkholderia pseudomallei]|nr:hypothetical protein EGY16_10850 [Burkholderia pseudomallei]EEH23826.1 hypothetical protein BUH_2427 [Burkholderia pseudomallei Pakistan 9]MBF3540495.1 hypothetical protein [Burkholderia pseudomallei]MBF3602691.1 hypothetical protein [Burkholderia pseudomallei]MPT65051.1 hypothetical protein [Burkholderia pseudomallei]